MSADTEKVTHLLTYGLESPAMASKRDGMAGNRSVLYTHVSKFLVRSWFRHRTDQLAWGLAVAKGGTILGAGSGLDTRAFCKQVWLDGMLFTATNDALLQQGFSSAHVGTARLSLSEASTVMC